MRGQRGPLIGFPAAVIDVTGPVRGWCEGVRVRLGRLIEYRIPLIGHAGRVIWHVEALRAQREGLRGWR